MKTVNFIKQSVVAALVIAAVAFTGCKETPEDIPGITIDNAALNQVAFADQTSITGGVTFTTASTWTATVTEGIAKAGVTWLSITPSSGDAGTHTISITLEPNTTGTDRAATITVTSGEMSIKIGITQKATKENGTAPVSDVTLNETALTLTSGQTATLTATVVPDDAGDKTITWTSSDETVATVVDGVVTAMDKGMAVIIVTTKDGGKTATCTVTVNKPVITMTTAKSGEVKISLAGSGNAVINWGDGSEPEEITILAPDDFWGLTDEHAHTHTFAGTSARNITIDGQNIAITYLTCHEGGLTRLDVSNNAALESLGCAANQLTSLDVSKNTALISLFCPVNQITSLDMNNNPALKNLNCSDNQLTSLNVSNNPALFDLSCPNNQITSIDVSKSTGLYQVICFNNQLTSLKMDKNITTLYQVLCYNNKLTSLDVSSSLARLFCYTNQLTSLDVSKCFWLRELSCDGNQLTSLNVSNNTILESLSCSANPLTSLDVSKNTELYMLNCGTNQLTSIDVSKNTALTSLRCYDNQLTSLDVSNNTALYSLNCSYNLLEAGELNALFGTLPGNTDSKYIYILTNPGTATCDQSIATAKGWTVTATNN